MLKPKAHRFEPARKPEQEGFCVEHDDKATHRPLRGQALERTRRDPRLAPLGLGVDAMVFALVLDLLGRAIGVALALMRPVDLALSLGLRGVAVAIGGNAQLVRSVGLVGPPTDLLALDDALADALA